MTRILLTGIHGQVGWELQRTLQPLGEVIALDRSQLDLAVPAQIRTVLREVRPTLIVNPAAFTAVDQAESDPETAMAINGAAPRLLAEEAKHLGALLVHYSTDYVFDGEKTTPYREDDPVAPLGVYGATKLAGELGILASGCSHLIFRTAWIYGRRGRNFLRTMLRLARERDELAVVDDQHGGPTWSRMIAEATALALSRHQGQQGIYHLAAPDATTWHGFATRIIALAHRQGDIERSVPIRRLASVDFLSAARRPARSCLDVTRLHADFGIRLPPWETQLDLCMDPCP